MVDKLAGHALMDLQPMNGMYHIHLGGNPNHRGQHGAEVVGLFTTVEDEAES